MVLLIGTNNVPHYTPDQIAAADAKIVRLIRGKIPGVKVLLLGILPRGPHQNRNGTGDDGVQAMAQVRAVGGDVEIEPAREKDHSHLGRDIGTPGDWITADVMRFIGRH